MGERETALSFHLHGLSFLWAHQPSQRVWRKQGALSPRLLTIIRDKSVVMLVDSENSVHRIFTKYPLCVIQAAGDVVLPSKNLQSSNHTPFTQKGCYAEILTKFPKRIPLLPGIFFPNLLRMGSWFMIIKQIFVLNSLLMGWKCDPPFEILKQAFRVFGSSLLL